MLQLLHDRPVPRTAQGEDSQRERRGSTGATRSRRVEARARRRVATIHRSGGCVLSAAAHNHLLELIERADLPLAEADCLRAAALGPEALQSLLDEDSIDASVSVAADEAWQLGAVFLEAIMVEGFRGVGPAAEVRFRRLRV